MSRKRGFFKGVIVGGIVAGTAALLLAPKAGEETRKDLAKKSKEVGDRLAKQLSDFKKSDFAKQNPDLISKAEFMRGLLAERAQDYSKAGKKISKTAATETAKLVDDSKELLSTMQSMQKDLAKQGGKLTKKASKSAAKVLQKAKTELAKPMQTKTPAKKPASKPTKK